MEQKLTPGSSTRHAILVFGGFLTILIILIVATSISLASLSDVNKRLENLVKENNVKSILLAQMRSEIRERMLNTFTITLLDDPFEIEKEWEEMTKHASTFLQTREQLYSLNLSPLQIHRLEEQRAVLGSSQQMMEQVLELVRNNQYEEARALSIEARRANAQVLDDLSEMLTFQQNYAQTELDNASLQYQEVRRNVLILDGVAIMICMGVISFVVYRIMYQEMALTEALVALKESNDLLEARVMERTADLLSARDEAVEASRTKSRFLANMSHELRTPLNAIIGYSEMLMEEAEILEIDDGFQDLKKIHSAGQHLLSLINDVLDISKIEAGKMNIDLESFNLRQLVEEVAATMQPLVDKRHNHFEVQFDPLVSTVYADKMRVRQVLFNLLSNASKFTEDGDITLHIKQFTQDDKSWVSLCVKDTGIGISEEQRQRLFKPFTQVDASATRKYGGTGLGLVISLRFCQLMGGTINVESELNKGCTFTVHLPQQVEHKPPLQDTQTAHDSTQDDAQAQCMARRFLSHNPNEVVTS